MWETLVTIGGGIFLLAAWLVSKVIIRRWSNEITQRGDERAKEDQAGTWVRRG